MKDYNTPTYEKVFEWITGQREDEKKSWDELKYASKGSKEGLKSFIEIAKSMGFFDKEVCAEDYIYICDLCKKHEEELIRNEKTGKDSIIIAENEGNALKPSTSPDSAWQCYKAGLLKKGFDKETVESIERSSKKILNRLDRDTTNKIAVRGLVIGNVQSGKTANMAALMAMAADWGWNMFIVLSGTVENLRVQTQTRLLNDLNDSNCKFSWRSLEKLSKNCSEGDLPQNLHFEEGNRDRYFSVCLKIKSRLSGLNDWLNLDDNKRKQMKVLVIDDEADQASIDTSKEDEDRKTINNLIINLVENRDKNSNEIKEKFQAMNYIGYTATPYANLLNEAKWESLYPKDFIATLKVSKEYFGPQQIFGAENCSNVNDLNENENEDANANYNGMDIIREISKNDLNVIKEIHKGIKADPEDPIPFGIPNSMKRAIAWFYDCVACRRYQHATKPVSMLIHTSLRTADHDAISKVVSDWIDNISKDDLMNLCEEVWNEETNEFTKEKFREEYPDYKIPDNEINDYPSFSDIKDILMQVIDYGLDKIKLNDEDEKEYHRGINLCIDNADNNNGFDEDGQFVRLVYPKNDLGYASAFLIIGGQTLSRGLTIEGLVSTYFVRNASQADTLMQMGRWFGYRKGYELLPRIWLTEKTRKQFEFLSDLDQDLRNEIYSMWLKGLSPKEYGPRIRNTPKYSFIRITAKNRMKNAVSAEVDYSGTFNQTHIFKRDEAILKHNLDLTNKFIESLSNPSIPSNLAVSRLKKCNAIYKNVPMDAVKNYLSDFKFHERLLTFNDISLIIKWLEKMFSNNELENWNVILSNGSSKSPVWKTINGVNIHKTNRAERINKNAVNDDAIRIGVLRAPNDLISDVDVDALIKNNRDDVLTNIGYYTGSKESDEYSSYSIPLANLIRVESGLENTPQLIIYCIDKNSKKQANSKDRIDMNVKYDVIGLAMNIPGKKRGANKTSLLTVDLSNFRNNPLDNEGDIVNVNEN